MAGNAWGVSLQPTNQEIQTAMVEEKKDITVDYIKNLTTDIEETSKICALVYGNDGSGKSGLVFSYLKFLKPDEKIVVIDLDGGCSPLIKQYYIDDYKKGRIHYVNPIVMDGEKIDYLRTFELITETIMWTKLHWKVTNTKAIVFDGLSTALVYAENQMRIEKNLQADGGVNMAFWKIRNKYFTQLMEQIKSIPIARFFISHEDFIAMDKDVSAVKQKTNQMMFQKILSEKIIDFDKIEFRATIHKSKFNIELENEKRQFAQVDKKNKTWSFHGHELWGILEQ